MNLTPAQLKFNARQLMDHRYPTGIAPVLTGALIYLLATRWVSLLLSLTTTNPINTILDKLQAAAATGSPAAVNAAVASLQGRAVLLRPAAALHPGRPLRLL